jgi:hypothetical protein
LLIRIALIDLDPMLAGIVAHHVEQDRECVLVARLLPRSQLPALIARTEVDGVITRIQPGWEADVAAVLERNPRANVVGVLERASAGVHYELRPESTVLDDVSPSALLAAAKARPDWTPAPEPLT